MLSASAHKIQDVLKVFFNPIFWYGHVPLLYFYQLLHHANPPPVLLLHWMVLDHVHLVHLQVINHELVGQQENVSEICSSCSADIILGQVVQLL